MQQERSQMSITPSRDRINRDLKRSLQSGKAYEKYFSPSDCKRRILGKGTTDKGMQAIAAMAKAHAHETSKLAKGVFSSNNLQQIATRLHRFTYDHFQYQINGELQELKAPNCMWSTRKEGSDCKSFSLFISTVLLNLGIKHYLRRIKQANYHPNVYTHVYVIIPIDQQNASLHNGYYTLDATINTMVELPFITKDDTYMESNLHYIGLSAAAMGCACQSDTNTYPRTESIGLSATYTQQPVTTLGESDYNQLIYESLERVDSFLDVLAPYTPSAHSSDQLRGKIFDKLWTGANPTLKFTRDGIWVDHDFVSFSKTFARIRKSGNNIGLLAASQMQTGSTTDVLNIALDAILGGDFFADTFGAIFANGFELTCWGSSYTPQQTSAEIAAIQAPYFQGLFEGIQSVRSVSELNQKLNFLARAVYVCRDMYWYLRVNENWRRCSRLALDLFNELFYALVPAFEAVVSSLSSSYIIREIRQEQTAASWTFEGYNHSWSENTTAEYPVFEVTSTAIDNGDVSTDNSSNPKPKPSKAKSSMTGVLIAAAAVGLLVTQTK